VVGIHNMQPYPLPILQAVYKSITLRMSMAAVQSAWRELLPLMVAGRWIPRESSPTGIGWSTRPKPTSGSQREARTAPKCCLLREPRV
jgi:hypothetical protein